MSPIQYTRLVPALYTYTQRARAEGHCRVPSRAAPRCRRSFFACCLDTVCLFYFGWLVGTCRSVCRRSSEFLCSCLLLLLLFVLYFRVGLFEVNY